MALSNDPQLTNSVDDSAYKAEQKRRQSAYTGGMPEYAYGTAAFSDGKIPTANYPAANENIKQLSSSQVGLANDYDKNAQGYINQQQNAFNQNARSGLANSIKSIRGGFNSRGLLRSGARLGAEGAARASTASDMAANRYSLNQQALANQQQLENNAVNSGLAYTGSAPGLGSSILAGTQQGLENDIANTNATQSLYNGVGGSLTNLAGSIIANQKKAA